MKLFFAGFLIASTSFYAGYYKAHRDLNVPIFASDVHPQHADVKPRDNSWIYSPQHNPLNDPAKKVGGKK